LQALPLGAEMRTLASRFAPVFGTRPVLANGSEARLRGERPGVACLGSSHPEPVALTDWLLMPLRGF